MGTAFRPVRRAYTLVELLVTAVIIMVLATLALSGMATARRRVRVDRTRTTIMKIHEIVMPQYESYLRRRVPASAATNALNRLVAIRQLTVREMPDTWNDVYADVSTVIALTGSNSYLKTGPVFSYAASKAALGAAGVSVANDSAECLYMIASRGAGEPDVMERFRSDEIGDTDKDGAPEFLDGWSTPIIFLRWAPGFSSPAQTRDATNWHDPMDPMRVDATAYSLTPLIVSGGPDRLTGLQVTTNGWSGLDMRQIVVTGSTIGLPDTANPSASADNVTNHDLIKR